MSNQGKRRIFFWILVVLFITTVPSVIFYARGYRFSLKRGIFIYAGSITVKQIPQSANIFIDNQPASKNKISFLNNAYHINGIQPGDHLLEISLPGYATWSKKVTVHSGISTEFWNVLLTKNEYAKSEYGSSGTKRFFISPKNDKAALAKNENQNFSVVILDLKSNKEEEIFSSPVYNFSSDEKENIEWSPKEEWIIIPAELKNQKHYFLVETATQKTIDLKDIAQTDDLKNVRWDPDNKNVLYYISLNNLYQLDVTSPENKILIAEKIASYDISSSHIYYLKLPEGLIYRVSPSNPGSPDQITTSPPDEMSNPNYHIIVYDEKRIALINNDDGKLYVYNVGDKDTYFRELSQVARGIQFSNDGKKILYFTDWEIFIYFTRDWDVQPIRLENEVRNITRFSENIKNVQWAKDYEHIIFSTGPSVKIIEADYRDHGNLMDIIKLNNDNPSVVANFPQSRLYFTDTQDGNSYLYFIDFPEKTGFFGIGG
jgi:hypothetical protein